MTKTDHRRIGATGGARGLAAAAGAIGRVIGYFRRIRFLRPGGRKDGEPRGARKRRAVQHGVLEVDIARLERELDDVYGQVVQGAGSLKRDEMAPEALDLQSLIELSRDLKLQLREKRAELWRIKRNEARRSRLRQTGWRVIDLPQERDRNVPRSTKKPPGSRSAPVSARLRKAIARASRRTSFQDDAQQVMFGKIVDDLLEDDPEIRRTAAARLGELGLSSALDILAAMLDDPHERVRVAALNSLALIGDPSSVELFSRFVGHEDHRLRIAALRGLSRLEGVESDLALIGGLEDEHASVRKAAATYLGWRQEKKATGALMRSLYDPEETVRAAAAASLGNIRDDRAVLPLMRALADPAQGVREEARTAIGATLGMEMVIDIRAEDGTLEQRIEQMKRWWKEARVQGYFERSMGPPLPEEPVAARPVEDAVGPQEPWAARDPEHVESSVPDDPKAEQEEASSTDSQDGLDNGFGGPNGLEGLGVSVTSSDPEATEDEKKKE